MVSLLSMIISHIIRRQPSCKLIHWHSAQLTRDRRSSISRLTAVVYSARDRRSSISRLTAVVYSARYFLEKTELQSTNGSASG